MFYSSRKGISSSSTTRKQTSITSKKSLTKQEDGNKSGNETDCGSTEFLDVSTSREDLSPSRCSCQSGGSNVAVRNEARDGISENLWSGNLRLEFDNNGGSDDEQLKDELLRIFDRERLGLESYFKQKTENILAGYRRKQYDWEENIRLERIEYEKTLAQEKIEIQQNYISEMTNLTKQFNQERIELESHYKKQIEELSQQFELRKKEMDATIIKERTELKERLELEYQAMLKSQKSSDEQRYHQQISELEESYKRKILELEQKLKDSFSDGELSGRRIQSDLEAKFEREKSILVVEWRKRVELLEVELGKEKERVNKEERKAFESQNFLKTEISKKDVELEKLRQIVETLKLELSEKENKVKEHELMQQNIFLRGSDALPGKLREDFEKMLAAHREGMERSLRKEREGLETEREARLVLERETIEKQLKVERERMSLDLEKERSEMRQASLEKEDLTRKEFREEMEKLRNALEEEKMFFKEQVRKEKDETLMKEKQTRDFEKEREIKLFKDQIRSEMLKEKDEAMLKEKESLKENIRRELMTEKQIQKNEKLQKMSGQNLHPSKMHREQSYGVNKSQRGRDEVMRDDEGLVPKHFGFQVDEDDQQENVLQLDEDEITLTGQRTKQWVEGQYRFTTDNQRYLVDSGELKEGGSKEDKRGHMDGKEGQECSKKGERPLKSQTNLENDSATAYENDYNNPSQSNKAREYCSVRDLSDENKGLKAKVAALQENIELHECFKKEASEEVQRLRETNKDLKIKLEEFKDGLKNNEELKASLKNYEKQFNDNRDQIKDNEEKLKEYEDICAEYERTLKQCRHRIMMFEKEQALSTRLVDTRGPEAKETMYKETKDNDNKSGNMKSQRKNHDKMTVETLENERDRLQQIIKSLEEKIKLLEVKISEISLTDNKAKAYEKEKLTSELQRVRKQNKGLVNKVKDFQCQLQAMVDKLKKKKKKIASLKGENQSLKFSHQKEICDLQRQLKYSGQVVKRLQHESSKESNHISRLQEEIWNINKMMMEERACEQRLIKARSVEEIERLDRDKVDLERKLKDARTALDCYSERLKNKVSLYELTGSQLSLNADTSLVREVKLSKTLQALENSHKTSQRQNERLQHEKHELRLLMSRIERSKEDNNGFGEVSPLSRSSSMSSLSSSSFSAFSCTEHESGLGNTKFSSSFSIFD